MKINRLTEIIVILLNKKNITAKELADKFQVSTRTIYRDIETLSLSGVPVYMNKGKGGGIFLLEDYSINKTILSENDKEGLGVALKILSSIEYPQINSVIDKIGFMRNKEVKLFDMSPYLNQGIFKDLKDENLFKAVKVSFDSIEWPNEADIDPETLYEDSIPYHNN